MEVDSALWFLWRVVWSLHAFATSPVAAALMSVVDNSWRLSEVKPRRTDWILLMKAGKSGVVDHWIICRS